MTDTKRKQVISPRPGSNCIFKDHWGKLIIYTIVDFKWNRISRDRKINLSPPTQQKTKKTLYLVARKEPTRFDMNIEYVIKESNTLIKSNCQKL